MSPTTQDLMASLVHWTARGFELGGVVTIVLIAVLASLRFARQVLASDWALHLASYRANIGRGVLLGLELLVAADILRTVAAPSTFAQWRRMEIRCCGRRWHFHSISLVCLLRAT